MPTVRRLDANEILTSMGIQRPQAQQSEPPASAPQTDISNQKTPIAGTLSAEELAGLKGMTPAQRDAELSVADRGLENLRLQREAAEKEAASYRALQKWNEDNETGSGSLYQFKSQKAEARLAELQAETSRAADRKYYLQQEQAAPRQTAGGFASQTALDSALEDAAARKLADLSAGGATIAQLAEAIKAYASYKARQEAARATTLVDRDIDALKDQIAQTEAERRDLASAAQAAVVRRGREVARSALVSGAEDAGTAALDARLADLNEQLALLEEEKYYSYNKLDGAPDFAALSRYDPARNREAVTDLATAPGGNVGIRDMTYAFINKDPEAQDITKLTAGITQDFLNEMTDAERARFNYLFAKDEAAGDKAHTNAYNYLGFIKKNLTLREATRKVQEIKDWMNSGSGAAQFGKKALASAATVAAAPLKAMSYLDQLMDVLTTGETDPNSVSQRFSYIPVGIRNTISQELESKWGKAGSFLYQTGMSMADFLYNAAITGGFGTVRSLGDEALAKAAGNLSLALMGTEAAADATLGAMERGVDSKRAVLLGTLAGAIETLTEKVSIEALFNRAWDESLGRYLVKNIVSEGGEEVASDLLNWAADTLIATDKSEWQQAIAEYERKGQTEKQAFRSALKDKLIDMGLSGLGGALSGGVMAGGAAAVGSVASRAAANREAREFRATMARQHDRELATIGRDFQSQDSAAELAKNTLAQAQENTKAFEAARTVQQMLRDGNTLSGEEGDRAVGELVVSVMSAPQEDWKPQPERQAVQEAVDKAQDAPYNEIVKEDGVTVLNKGTTAYLTTGMKENRAAQKAAIVEKLVKGEAVKPGELQALNLHDPKFRAIFTELTGVQFPEGRLTEQQLFQAALTAKEAYEARAEQEQAARQAAESAAKAAAEAARAVQAEAQVVIDGAESTFEEFMQAARRQPGGDRMTDAEARQAFAEIAQAQGRLDRLTVPDPAGDITYQAFIDTARKQDTNITPEQADRLFIEAFAEGENQDGETAGAGAQLDRASGEGVRAGLSEIDRRSEGGRAPGQGDVSASGSLVNGIDQTAQVSETTDRQEFADRLAEAREADPENGWAVTPKSAEELEGHRMFLSGDGGVGFAVSEDGDIQAGFRNRNRHPQGKAFKTALPQAIAAGGRKLDCYGSDLVQIYAHDGGMRPVARVEFNPEYANDGWTEDKGKPYIYFMVATDTDEDTIRRKQGAYPVPTDAELEALPTFGPEGYDEAAQYRDRVLAEMEGEGEDPNGAETGTAAAGERDQSGGTRDAIVRADGGTARGQDGLPLRESRQGSTAHTESARLGEKERKNTNRGFRSRGVGVGALPNHDEQVLNPSFGEEPNYAWARGHVVQSVPGTLEYEEQQTAASFGVPSFVIGAEVWDKEHGMASDGKPKPAFAHNGQIYLRDGLEERYRGSYASHEIVHIMRELGYTPYIDFLAQTPSRLNLSHPDTPGILRSLEEHTGKGVDSDGTELLTEFNATLFGSYAAWLISPEQRQVLASVIYDYDSYIEELKSIVEQFREYNSAQRMSVAVVPQAPTANPSDSGGLSVSSPDVREWVARQIEPARRQREIYSAAMTEQYGAEAVTRSEARVQAAYDAAQEEAEAAPVTAEDIGSVAQGEGDPVGWVVYPTTAPEQDAGNPSVGAADLGFDPYSNLANRYGTIPQTGNRNVRVVDNPKSTTGADRVSKTATTVMGAAATPDSRLNDLAQAVVDGDFSYLPIRDRQANQKAVQRIRAEGWSKVAAQFIADARAGRAGKDLVALGAALLNNAGNGGATAREYIDLALAYNSIVHTSAQALQAAGILQKLTPEGRLYAVAGTVRQLNDMELNRHRKGNLPTTQWMNAVGKLLADEMMKRVRGKATGSKVKTVSEQVLGDLLDAARQTLEREPGAAVNARTEFERLVDMFRNRENYQKAWEEAKQLVQAKFGGEPQVMEALDGWIDATLELAPRLTRELFGAQLGEIKMDEALAEQYLAAETDAARAAAMERILQNIADQLVASPVEKFTAWRYMSMLGNLRTIGRNVAGNLLMQPVRMTKTAAQGLVEALLERIGVDIERTASLGADAATYKEALAHFGSVREVILRGGKYSDGARAAQTDLLRRIYDRRRVYNNGVLEAVRNGIGWLMNNDYFGDAAFAKFTYADALARFMKANRTTWAEASEELRARGQAAAMREAAEATYHDVNELSRFFSGLRIRNPDTAFKRGVNLVGEGIAPFRETPANIARRIYEYSPLYLPTAVSDLVRVLKNSPDADLTGTVNEFAKAFTGTGLLVLGMLLHSLGVLKGSKPKDDKERQLWEAQGHQEYSVEIDGQSYTVDWASPAAAVLLVGAQISELQEDGFQWKDLFTAATTITDPLISMSMLQGINNALEDTQSYGKESALIRLLINSMTSYVTQAVPTVLGQVERSLTNTRMTTYTDPASPLPDTIQRIVGKLSAKVPGWDYHQVEYIDVWGRTQENANTPTLNVLQQFLSPGYFSAIRETPMEQELLRLREATGESGVLLSTAPRYLTVAGQKLNLTGAEYVVYAAARGSTAFRLLTEITDSAAYQNLSDSQRASVVQRAYDYANAVARASVAVPEELKPYTGLPAWVQEMQTTVQEYGVAPGLYLILRQKTATVGSLKDGAGKTITNSKGLQILEALYGERGLTDAQRRRLAEDFGAGKTVLNYSREQVAGELKRMRSLGKN